MNTSNEKARVKIRLSQEEKTKLKHDAALCGLSQSEYLRQLCLGRRPRPQQLPEFWALMDALYQLHYVLERLVPYYPAAADECSQIENLVLLLQEAA